MSDQPFWGGDESYDPTLAPSDQDVRDEPEPGISDDSDPDADVDDASDADGPGGSGRESKDTPRGREQRGVSRAKMLRAAQKALDLHGADETRRHRVGVILGLDDPDIPALAVAAVEAGRASVSRPVDDIEKIATAEPMVAVVAAIAQAENRDRFATAWAVAGCYSERLGKRPPSVPTKAAFEFASAVCAFGEDVFADMQASLELVRR